MRTSTLVFITFVFLFTSQLVAAAAAAQTPDQSTSQTSNADDVATRVVDAGILDDVTGRFLAKAKSWRKVISSAANYIFWTLGVISLVWTGVTMILRKGDLGEFLAEFFKFSMFFGFFLWLLQNGPQFAYSILKSLTLIGLEASGTRVLTPDNIVAVAFNIFGNTLVSFFGDPIKALLSVAIGILILFFLVSVAINVLLLNISGYIVMYAGIFVLGFGGSRWTSEMAINYYKTVLGIAVQIMVAILLVSIGLDTITAYQARLTQGLLKYGDLAVLLIVAMVLRELTVKIPPMVAGMISAATGGQQIGAASAAGVAAAAAAYAGTTLAAAKQTVGAGSAVVAAVKAAMASEASSGGDVIGRMRESASLASAFPGRSSSGEAASPSRGGSSNSSSRPSSVDQAAGKSASDSSRLTADAPPKTTRGLSASTDRDDPSSSTSQGGASVGTPDAPASQAPAQDSGSPLSRSPASLASEAPANSSFSLQDGPSSSNGSGNGTTPNESSESSLQSSRETMSSGSKPLAQNLSASTGPAKPWEVADGQVPRQDISQTAPPAQPEQSLTSSTDSPQSQKDDSPADAKSQALRTGSDTPVRPSATGRIARVAMGAAGHLATGAMASVKKNIAENTVGGRIAAGINARREEAERRGKENRNYIASAGPDFHAEVQELLNMNQKIDS